MQRRVRIKTPGPNTTLAGAVISTVVFVLTTFSAFVKCSEGPRCSPSERYYSLIFGVVAVLLALVALVQLLRARTRGGGSRGPSNP